MTDRQPSTSDHPAGWYHVPHQPGTLAEWDGRAATGRTCPAPAGYVDPAGWQRAADGTLAQAPAATTTPDTGPAGRVRDLFPNSAAVWVTAACLSVVAAVAGVMLLTGGSAEPDVASARRVQADGAGVVAEGTGPDLFTFTVPEGSWWLRRSGDTDVTFATPGGLEFVAMQGVSTASAVSGGDEVTYEVTTEEGHAWAVTLEPNRDTGDRDRGQGPADLSEALAGPADLRERYDANRDTCTLLPTQDVADWAAEHGLGDVSGEPTVMSGGGVNLEIPYSQSSCRFGLRDGNVAVFIQEPSSGTTTDDVAEAWGRATQRERTHGTVFVEGGDSAMSFDADSGLIFGVDATWNAQVTSEALLDLVERFADVR